MRLQLRDYQLDTLDRIDEAEARGVRRLAVTAATGLGKTVMFCGLAERRQARTLILAHRDELINQAAAKVAEIWPETQVGIVKAAANEVNAHVVVASVQTLSRPSRLDLLTNPGVGFFAPDAFDLIVVDEMHHAAADSYVRILDALAPREADAPLLVGFTATLDRGDGKGLDHLFDEVVADWPILWGIQHGFLCDLRGLRIRIAGLDLRKVKTTAGDYNQGQAGAALEDAGAPEAIVGAWALHAHDRKRTLVFTPTIEVARQVADAFHGVAAAEYVSGETPLDERRAILGRFESGETAVLANCAVLTEGYDNPGVDCIVVARPTKSRGLYTQMVGRGTRRYPDKTDCLILDVVGATDLHSLVSLPSLFGVEHPAEFEGKGIGVAEYLEAQAEEAARLGRITAAEAELFRAVRQSGIAWTPVHERGEHRRYVRALRRDEPTVVLAELDDGMWGALLRNPSLGMQAGYTKITYGGDGSTVLVRGVSQEIAQGVAEQWIGQRDSARLARADAGWRKAQPTDKTKRFAKQLKVDVARGATAGEVSDAIDAVLAKRNERKLLDDIARRAAVRSVS